MTTMTTIMNKRTYILLILLCLLVANTTQAQIYSTANYRGASNYRNTSAAEASFHNTPACTSTSSMRVHSTAAQTMHTYGGSSSASGSQASHGIIRTKATAITGGSLADNVGYIAINPRKTVMNEATFTNTDIENTGLTSNDNGYIDDDDTLPPPQFAPLSFRWDAILLMLLLACAYAIHIKVRSKKAKTRNYLKYLE